MRCAIKLRVAKNIRRRHRPALGAHSEKPHWQCNQQSVCCIAKHWPSSQRFYDAANSNSDSSASSIRFPPSSTFKLGDGQADLSATQVCRLLRPVISSERLHKIQKVVSQRTFSFLPIAEDLHDMGNLAAVCRSADAMGFGSIHVINRSEQYKQSQRTSAGADKWLEATLWQDARECYARVKEAGYQLLVTRLTPEATPIEEMDLTMRTAIVLGNEKSGVSDTAVAMADRQVAIPMLGFVESFNISVAAALLLYEARQQRHQRWGQNGDLTPQEQERLEATYLLRSIKSSRTILMDFLSREPPQWQRRHFRDRK